MFLGSNHADLSAYMRAKFSSSPTVVSKKGGSDRQRDDAVL